MLLFDWVARCRSALQVYYTVSLQHCYTSAFFHHYVLHYAMNFLPTFTTILSI
ncbi:hypothetical protein AHF37_00957 [Paragonimus kellicotti]|nr:hypothetical protein AHF37_00957 [Paragonimus kellicotti]